MGKTAQVRCLPELKIGDIVYAVDTDPEKLLMCRVVGAEYMCFPDNQADDWFYSLEAYNLGKRTFFCKWGSNIFSSLEELNHDPN